MTWHYGISLLFLMLTGFVNLMLLNVYIGLLSALYDKYAAKRDEHFEEFRCAISWKLLLAQRGWRVLLRFISFGRCTPGFFKDSVRSVTEEDLLINKESHIWIAYNPSTFKGDEDSSESISGLRKEVDIVRQGTKEVLSALTEIKKQMSSFQDAVDHLHGRQDLYFSDARSDEEPAVLLERSTELYSLTQDDDD